jgi:hypothetical protein
MQFRPCETTNVQLYDTFKLFIRYMIKYLHLKKTKKSVAWIRERTIPTEQLLLVG